MQNKYLADRYNIDLVSEGYVYFDLFNHNAATNMVKLKSPPIAANGDQYCMSFWFAAFGAGEDADLKVIREDNSTSDNPSEVRTLINVKL